MSCKGLCLPTTVIEPAATMNGSRIWIQRMVGHQVGRVENRTRHARTSRDRALHLP
jgi:hypothetical protein